MKESKHTPAPWRVEKGGANNDLIWVEDIVGNTVCDLYFRNDYSALFSHENDEANAHLIAAAPELLEALEIFSKLDYRRHYDVQAAIHIAKCAVAKARGEHGKVGM